jgi:hypothetical protein
VFYPRSLGAHRFDIVVGLASPTANLTHAITHRAGNMDDLLLHVVILILPCVDVGSGLPPSAETSRSINSFSGLLT